MATQAVKALNAVKASQMEQAQALKARAETSQDEQALAWEEEAISLDGGEPARPLPEEPLAAIRAQDVGEVSVDVASPPFSPGRP
jgi:hypothetical protein